MRTLLAIPVYNEQKHVTKVLDEVRRYARDILVIDDGSTDETPLLLAKQPVEVVRHARNRGYGQSMIAAFRWATCQCYCYDWLITMDCDEQHQPASLPDFHAAIQQAQNDRENGADVISGSRYMTVESAVTVAPTDRRAINRKITAMVNDRLGLRLTDAFCGFKAYRVKALRRLTLDETGYAFPLQFWVQAVANGLRITELPIDLIYNDPNRSFGGSLDNPDHRLAHYTQVFERELAKFPDKFPQAEPACANCDSEE
ncbi:MAG: glycosyltransferase family 2 protein [Phycisphaeraceae bacterium]|nr:glycosyltransferase family 2 protein [Phycisphaeraceae bacterium]